MAALAETNTNHLLVLAKATSFRNRDFFSHECAASKLSVALGDVVAPTLREEQTDFQNKTNSSAPSSPGRGEECRLPGPCCACTAAAARGPGGMCSKWSDEALSLQDLSHIFTSCFSRLTSWCCPGVTKLCWPLLKVSWNCSLSTAPKLSSRDGREV